MDKINFSSYEACFLGSAIGDALGAPVEMQKDFPKVTEMLPLISEKFNLNLPAGTWTDDTAMLMCLSESLIQCKGLDAKSELEKYVKWLYEGYMACGEASFGSGGTTRMALAAFLEKGQLVADTQPEWMGNGSVMRLAPVPLFYANKNLSEVLCRSRESSITTHTNDVCMSSCALLGGIIWRALQGDSKEAILAPMDDKYVYLIHPDVLFVLNKKTYKCDPPYIAGIGHALKTVEAALWAFHNGNSFEESLILAVNLGDDTDTVAAITGAISGIYYGLDSIPERWMNALQKREMIRTMAKDLYLAKT